MAQTLAYMRLRTSNGSLDKRFRVLFDGYRPNISNNDQHQRTITGKLDVNVSARYREWPLVVKVLHTEIDSNYATLADLITFYSLRNPQGTPSNQLSFYSHVDSNDDGTGDLYTVILRGNLDMESLTVMLTGTSSFWVVPLTLAEVNPI